MQFLYLIRIEITQVCFNYFQRTIQLPEESSLIRGTSTENVSPATLEYTDFKYIDESTIHDMITSDDEMLSTTPDDLVTKEILRPLQNETQGSFIFFISFRTSTIYKTAAFSLGGLCFVLFVICLACCLSYCKQKRVNRFPKFKVSDENLFENNDEDTDSMERGIENVRMRAATDSSVFSI